MNFMNGKKRLVGALTLVGSTALYILQEPTCAERLTSHLAEGGVGSGLMLLVLGLIHAREKRVAGQTLHDPGA